MTWTRVEAVQRKAVALVLVYVLIRSTIQPGGFAAALRLLVAPDCAGCV